MNSKGDMGDYQWDLWEDIEYDYSLGGYTQSTDAVTDPNNTLSESVYTREWVKSRGFASEYITEVSQDSNPDVNVDLYQDLTSLENPDDAFHVDNWGSDLIDMDQVCSDQNTLTLSGVNNPREFTVDELKAMPQTTGRTTIQCATNGINGVLAYNVEYTGVSLKYLIEQCGGLQDGVNEYSTLCSDGWTHGHMGFPISDVLDTAVVAYLYDGQPISQANGAPIVFMTPGEFGATYSKHITNLNFYYNADVQNFWRDHNREFSNCFFVINSAFFQDDGVEVKYGDSVDLTGYSMGQVMCGGGCAKVEFSFDMGNSWKAYDASSMDPYQWTQWTVHWNPNAPGTYIVKCRATSTSGQVSTPVSLIVKVTD